MPLLSPSQVDRTLRQVRKDADFSNPEFADLDETLDADGWHSAVTAGALPLVLDGLTTAVAASRRARPPPADEVAYHIRRLALYLTDALTGCRCRDEATITAYLALLRRLDYERAQLLGPPLGDCDAPVMLLVSVLEEAVGLVSELQPAFEETVVTAALYGLTRRASRHCVVALDGVGMRARSQRLAANPMLPPVLVDWSTWCARRAAAGHVASSGYRQLSILALCAPVQLIAGVPGVFRRLLANITRLCRPRPSTVTARHLFNLFSVVYTLSMANVAGWRATGATGLRALSAIARVLRSVPDADARPVDTYSERLLLLVSVLASADVALGAVGLAPWADASTGGLALLISLAESEDPEAPNSYSMCPPAMVLHVARALLAAGHPPSTLRPVARAMPLWARLMSGPDRDRVGIAMVLGLLAPAVGGGDNPRAGAMAVGLATAPALWAPHPYPPRAVPNLRREHLCWACGGHTREADVVPMALRKCPNCKVARFCSDACAEAGWWEGHRDACEGWAALRDVDAGANGAGADADGGEDLTGFLSIGLFRDLRAPAREWAWAPAVAAAVTAAGLPLSAVVAIVEPGWGYVVVMSDTAYRHYADAAPAATLDAAAARHGGVALRVVHRVQPLRMLVFGPAALRLPVVE